jgi:ubiquinone/menaquinone biosynthesis C-methylase UbiE
MVMHPLEKRFVNATAHSRQVANHALRRLGNVPLQSGWRYLDVGCGNGLATIHVADALGLRAVGVDVDPAQVELARRAAGGRTDVSFVTASATHLPFDAARFHIVSTNKALHHVPDWWLALEELKRVVAPGGYVVFADLNVPSALVPLVRPAIGRAAGIFTRRDLDRCFAGLDRVHRHAGWLHYEAVFAKR